MKLKYFTLLLFLFISACSDEKNATHKRVEKKSVSLDYSGQLNTSTKKGTSFALLEDYFKRTTHSLSIEPFILLINNKQLTPQQRQAQQIAIADQRFVQYVKHPQTGQPLRNEIMTIRKLLAADLDANIKMPMHCKNKPCYRVEMYNFFFNMSVVAFVTLDKGQVFAITRYADAQPDLNQNMHALAIAIAKHSPLVKEQLKLYGSVEPTMSQIKTSLKHSRCERSHHLCVAPTFVINDRALWAIVDLTVGELVGIRWTELGRSGAPIEVTERQLENEFVFTEFCEKSQYFKQGNWSFQYQITASDGMEITNVRYKDKRVLNSAKLLDWHVSYSTREGFGYSDAIGCPLFSSAVVIAYQGPKVANIKEQGKKTGFSFVQDFRQPPWPTPCNYRYEQRFEFYEDGRFRVAAADYGRGCGSDGTYRPIFRIDLEVADGGIENFAQWDGKSWQPWQVEQWQLQRADTIYNNKGYLFRMINAKQQGFYIEPNRGQFGDGSKGDFAYTYITANHPDIDEGKTDVMTLGKCCNTDFQQGPEQFMNPPEKLHNKNLVLWYVPQIKNDGRPGKEYCWADTRVENGIKNIKVWPCFAGPMFHPIL